jgi:hypothetical protein
MRGGFGLPRKRLVPAGRIRFGRPAAGMAACFTQANVLKITGLVNLSAMVNLPNGDMYPL